VTDSAETLRLYPPAIAVFMRQALADVEIAGYTLSRNSRVQMVPYVCQNDPRWFPEPETFDPDRFLPERQPLSRPSPTSPSAAARASVSATPFPRWK
jgi:cytochrome P450